MVADSEDNTPPRKKAKMASNGAAAHGEMAIDEDLHSRQLAVYGRESMRRMAASSIMVVGLKGLGVEIGERPCSHRHRHSTRWHPHHPLTATISPPQLKPAALL